MYYTDDSILPENMTPLIITAAPYGPEWIPGDADIPVTWDEQVQAAVDCYNAGATMLHVHVRDPATGHGSVDFEQFNYFIGRLKKAVPKMVLQVGGSISFAPKSADAKAKWLDYDTRHMLTELDPKPEFVTIATGTTEWDIMSWMSADDVKGTHLENNPKVQAAWAGMWVDAGPASYLEHLKRLSRKSHSALFRACPRSSTGDHRTVDPRGRLHGSDEPRHRGVWWRHSGPQSLPLDGFPPPGSSGEPLNPLDLHCAGESRSPPSRSLLGRHVHVGNEDNCGAPDEKNAGRRCNRSKVRCASARSSGARSRRQRKRGRS